MRPVSSFSIVGPYADKLLAADLPKLAASSRAETVRFIARRVDGMPSVTQWGVLAIGAFYRVLLALPGGWRLAKGLAGAPLPLLGEYPRLVRSLGYAYVWEHWPSTRPDGASV